MDAIRIPIMVESTKLELPQLEQFMGKVVVVTVTPVPQPATCVQDFQDVADAIGPIDYDPNLLQELRAASMTPLESWADEDDSAPGNRKGK